MKKVLLIAFLLVFSLNKINAQPDLYIDKCFTENGTNASSTYIEDRWIWDENDQPLGEHKVLAFGTLIANMGTTVANFGEPNPDSGYYYDINHGHWHIKDFIVATLIDCKSNVIASGRKIGYALSDNSKFYPNDCQLTGMAPYGGYPQWMYNTTPTLGLEGKARLTPGFCDPYNSDTEGNHIIIDSLPNGYYTLHLKVNIPSWVDQGLNNYPDEIWCPLYIQGYTVYIGPNLGSAPTIYPPQAVTNIQVNNRTITWNPSPTACRYKVQAKLVQGTAEFDTPYSPQIVEEPIFVDTWAVKNKFYRWYITPINEAGEGSPTFTTKKSQVK
jgi:hypothetical protein